MYIKANVEEGLIAADKVNEIQKWTDEQITLHILILPLVAKMKSKQSQ